MNIKDLIKDKTVHFQYARDKELWYKTTDGFMFPVPFDDMEKGTFLRNDKALYFMRYIRKQVQKVNEETLAG